MLCLVVFAFLATCCPVNKLFLYNVVSGTETLGDMIEKMIGKRPNIFFLVCWKYISPIATLVRLFYFGKETPIQSCPTLKGLNKLFLVPLRAVRLKWSTPEAFTVPVMVLSPTKSVSVNVLFQNWETNFKPSPQNRISVPQNFRRTPLLFYGFISPIICAVLRAETFLIVCFSL